MKNKYECEIISYDRYEPKVNAYLPRDRSWIKDRVLNHLKKLAMNGQ